MSGGAAAGRVAVEPEVVGDVHEEIGDVQEALAEGGAGQEHHAEDEVEAGDDLELVEEVHVKTAGPEARIRVEDGET